MFAYTKNLINSGKHLLTLKFAFKRCCKNTATATTNQLTTNNFFNNPIQSNKYKT